MTRPRQILAWMAAFVVLVAIGCAFLFGPLTAAFASNPGFNGVILAVLGAGIVVNFRHVVSLYPEIEWIEDFRSGHDTDHLRPRLLLTMAQMLGGHAKRTLSATSMRTLLDSIRTRLEESRDISRYLIGLLIFLGLLGTFWGLMQTVGAVSGVIDRLAVESGDVAAVFDMLKQNLQKPLGGMGIAFSSSLFGLAGSLVLGFLDLQAAHAQNRFVNELEEWLAGSARLSSGSVGDDFTGGAPAYVQALLEQTADVLEQMQRARAVEGNLHELTTERLETLADAIAALNRQLDLHNERLGALAANQHEIPRLLERLAARDHAAAFSEELRAEMRLLNRTLANVLKDRDG